MLSDSKVNLEILNGLRHLGDEPALTSEWHSSLLEWPSPGGHRRTPVNWSARQWERWHSNMPCMLPSSATPLGRLLVHKPSHKNENKDEHFVTSPQNSLSLSFPWLPEALELCLRLQEEIKSGAGRATDTARAGPGLLGLQGTRAGAAVLWLPLAAPCGAAHGWRRPQAPRCLLSAPASPRLLSWYNR